MDHTAPVIAYQPDDGRRRLRYPAWVVMLLVLAGCVGLMIVGGMMNRGLTPATPREIAAAQSAYDRAERFGSRGGKFYELTSVLDRTGRGVLTEREIVQRLGPPDGQLTGGGSKVLAYYYGRSGARDDVAVVELPGGVLVHFGYTGMSQYPPSKLQPYVPPPAATLPTPSPATAPSGGVR